MVDIKNIIDDSEADFDGDTASLAVSEIIKKYNLKDFDEESVEKLIKGEPFIFPGAVINDCAKKIALGTTSDEEIESSLENQLGIKKEVAEELIKDIKIKVVPIIQTALKIQANGVAVKISTNNIGKKYTPPPTAPRKKIAPSEESSPIKKRLNKKIQENETIKKPSDTNGQDSYREPIQ